MPYALFCDDAKVSRTYPTEANVWKHAKESGLVIDVEAKDNQPTPRRLLDNGYEVRFCDADPDENPEENERNASEQREFQFSSDAIISA